MVLVPQAAFEQPLLAKAASPWFVGMCELWTPSQLSFSSVLESYLWEFLFFLGEADTPKPSLRGQINLFSRKGKTPDIKRSGLKCDV